MSGALLDYGSISVLQNLLDKERRKPGALPSVNRVTQGPSDRTIYMVRPNSGATASPLMLGKMLVGIPGAWTTIGDIAVRALDNTSNLVPGKEYQGTFGGYDTISGTEYAVYDVEPGLSGSFLSANYIGETCIGFHRPGINANPVYSGGANGVGYTEVYVPVGPGSNPESVLETWRLHHITDRATGFGIWSANHYQSGVYKVPNFNLPTKHTLRFTGKRGDQYAANSYNCYHFSPQHIAVMGTIKVSDDVQNNSFSFDNQNFYAFNQFGAYPVFGTMTTVKWNVQGWIGSSNLSGAFLNIMSWWNTAKRGPENITAWIGYTWPHGWHPIMIDPVPQKIAGYGPSGYYQGPYPSY